MNDALDWLESHINYERTGPNPDRSAGFSSDPERRLRHLRRYMELMGEPQRLYPSLHITGTNGKTSTARILTALIMAQGLRTGTYTSPHLEKLNERILLNAEPISDGDFYELLSSLRLLDAMLEGEEPSYFEILTAAAFRYFADAPVDAAVVEVGVGGRWDATNVMDGTVSVVTNIAMDHANYLGTTLESIASHKAGIIKEGSVAVVGETRSEFLDIWEQRKARALLLAGRDFGVARNDVAVGGRLISVHTPCSDYDDVFLSLRGAFQADNAAIALTAAEAFFDAPLSAEVVREGLGSVDSPGRMEIAHRSPLCVIDGAHNVTGAAALAATLDEEFSSLDGRIYVIGLLGGHDPADILPALGVSRARLVLACTAPSPRAIPGEEIASAAGALGVPAAHFPDVESAVQEALAAAGDTDVIVVTGSLYVVGAARAALRR